MPNYFVGWGINLEAKSPIDAAKKALDIQRDTTSLATRFDVCDEATGFEYKVDLTTTKRSDRCRRIA